MASAILSQFSAPSVDGQALRRVLAPVIMENIVQDILLRDGYGVTEKFSTCPCNYGKHCPRYSLA